jgi:futalosine hydrolase
LNAGIAGSFSDKYDKGSVVRVREDFFSELGAEDGENFISIDELGLGFSKVEDKTSNQISTPALFRSPFVRAITVNRVHGNEKSIQAVLSRLQPEIETMEGAAFSLVCKKEGIPFIHVRSISNKVERRNRSEWNVPLAIENLNQFLLQLIPELS